MDTITNNWFRDYVRTNPAIMAAKDRQVNPDFRSDATTALYTAFIRHFGRMIHPAELAGFGDILDELTGSCEHCPMSGGGCIVCAPVFTVILIQ